MKPLAILHFAMALAFVSASPFAKIAEHVNQLDTTWKARAPVTPIDLAHARKLCGTFLPDHPDYEALPELVDPRWKIDATLLPEQFNWVAARPDCPSLRLVRDQSSCGSCWAFSSTECFNDRLCIKHNNTRILSAEDTVSCCRGLACGVSLGCNGGQPGMALRWMVQKGVVTGAGYESIGDGKTCRPYTMAPCAHHIPPSKQYPECPPDYPTPKCTSACSEEAYPVPYGTDKTKGTQAYSVRGVDNIMADLYQNGPLSVALTVYADFLTYASGVYTHVQGAPLGGHAVELVGWGTEEGTPYWLVKNSWNDQWGLNGYVKIKRGVDECGIESSVSGIRV